MSRRDLLAAVGHDNVDSALRELERTKNTIQQYQRWFTEFPDVVLVLNNLAVVAEGKTSLDAGFPPSDAGPWNTSGLRDVLRAGAK